MLHTIRSTIDAALKSEPRTVLLWALPITWALLVVVALGWAGVAAANRHQAADTLIEIARMLASFPVVAFLLVLMLGLALGPQMPALAARISELKRLRQLGRVRWLRWRKQFQSPTAWQDRRSQPTTTLRTCGRAMVCF